MSLLLCQLIYTFLFTNVLVQILVHFSEVRDDFPVYTCDFWDVVYPRAFGFHLSSSRLPWSHNGCFTCKNTRFFPNVNAFPLLFTHFIAGI